MSGEEGARADVAAGSRSEGEAGDTVMSERAEGCDEEEGRWRLEPAAEEGGMELGDMQLEDGEDEPLF